MKILYFAWIKLKVGIGEEEVTPPDDVDTVDSLIHWLKTRSPGFHEAFADLNTVRMAVNQDYVSIHHPIGPFDEIAFFPPVTGG